MRPKIFKWRKMMFVKIFNKFPIFILIMTLTLTFNVSAEMPGMSGEIRTMLIPVLGECTSGQ